ncbi:MAG: cell wall-binding repeat-containing protein [Dermatophilaceae bacterium]
MRTTIPVAVVLAAALVGAAAPTTAAGASAAAAGDALERIRASSVEAIQDAGELRDPTGSTAAGSTAAPPGYETDRIAGANRYITSALISRATYLDASTVDDRLYFGQVVFVTTGQNYPDALAAGPAAASLFGSILLVPSRGTVPTEVLDEISRLHGESPPAGTAVVVLGSEDAVSDEVAWQVFAAAPGSPEKVRLAGKNRYDTAAKLAEFVVAWDESGDTPVPVDPDTVYLASGETYADALAGGAAAAWEYAPLLLTQSGRLPAETEAALRSGRYSTVKILGSPATISDAVESRVRSVLPGADIVRYAGTNRFETAAMMNADAFGEPDAEIHLASGINYPDALAVAPRVNLTWGPTVLTLPSCLPTASADTIDALTPWMVTALGRSQTVSDAALAGTVCP